MFSYKNWTINSRILWQYLFPKLWTRPVSGTQKGNMRIIPLKSVTAVLRVMKQSSAQNCGHRKAKLTNSRLVSTFFPPAILQNSKRDHLTECQLRTFNQVFAQKTNSWLWMNCLIKLISIWSLYQELWGARNMKNLL